MQLSVKLLVAGARYTKRKLRVFPVEQDLFHELCQARVGIAIRSAFKQILETGIIGQFVGEKEAACGQYLVSSQIEIAIKTQLSEMRFRAYSDAADSRARAPMASGICSR